MSRTVLRTFQVTALLVALGSISHLGGDAENAQSDAEGSDRAGLETSSVVSYDINVKVNGNEAVLTGKVATAEQKAEAVAAKVASATTVQDAIVIDNDADRTTSERVKNGMTKTGDKISDTWITTKVKWFYWGDDRLRGSDISVSTTDHVVTLKGTVKNLDGRTRAVQLATDTEGVKRVIDELTIANPGLIDKSALPPRFVEGAPSSHRGRHYGFCVAGAVSRAFVCAACRSGRVPGPLYPARRIVLETRDYPQYGPRLEPTRLSFRTSVSLHP